MAELTERFLRSADGAALDDPDHRSLLESLLWFGTDYGPGDPLGWSPTRVEILLLDWLPRKIVAEAGFLAKAPDLLRALIRFSHHERGIRPSLTEQTLRKVDEYEPEYQRLVRSPRPQGAMALLAAMGLPIADAPWSRDELPDPDQMMLDSLAEIVGGEAALSTLDTTPLPAEEFDGSGIPPDVRDRVGEVLERVDACCAELLDLEYRTAARRLLAARRDRRPGHLPAPRPRRHRGGRRVLDRRPGERPVRSEQRAAPAGEGVGRAFRAQPRLGRATRQHVPEQRWGSTRWWAANCGWAPPTGWSPDTGPS